MPKWWHYTAGWLAVFFYIQKPLILYTVVMIANIYTGIKAIGWVVTDGNKVIDFGVKKSKVSFDSYYEFISGNKVSKRIVRREKRQARRNLQRRKYQKNKLLYELLKEFGVKPNLHLSSKEVSQLRIKAIQQKLSVDELVTVIYSYTKRRGYKSQRGVDEIGTSDYLAEIKSHEDKIKDYPTLSAYLLTLPTLNNVIIRRESYEKEFLNILKFQGFSEEQIKKYHKLVYFQRPLKKGKINNCKFEHNRKVTHESNPLYQELRIYRDAWNIHIKDKGLREIEIPKEIRLKIADDLLSGKDITKAKVCRYLGLKKSSQYQWLSGKKIEGNFWRKITDRDIDFYQLWQDLRGMSDDEHIVRLLREKWNFNDLEIDNYFENDISKKVYSEYSEKAIKKLLPYVKEMPLKNAILEVYGEYHRAENIYLRNLVVEQVYDSTKSLIEALKDKYPIEEVKLEIEYELKISNKARKELAKKQRAKDKELKEIKDIIVKYAEPTQYNIRKYKLAKETNFTDVYTLKEIPLSELFTDKYNIDHIIPKSKYFDFGNNNLVVTDAKVNQKKSGRTAFDFMEGGSEYSEYIEFVENLKITEKKKQLLLTSEKDIPQAIRDSVDYNTKCFLALFENSVNIPNKVINFYQKKWKLNKYDNNDIRYYLEKALTIAGLPSDITSKLNTTPKEYYSLYLPIEMPNYDIVIPFLPREKRFRKVGNNIIVRGQMHDDTIYGKSDEYFTIRKPIWELSNKMISEIIDKNLQELILSKIDEYGDLESFKMAVKDKGLKYHNTIVKTVKIKRQSKVLTKINRGYVKPEPFGVDMTGKFYNIFDALNIIKSGGDLSGITQKNKVVRYDGRLWYIVGIGIEGISLRNVYDLEATKLKVVARARVRDFEFINNNQV